MHCSIPYAFRKHLNYGERQAFHKRGHNNHFEFFASCRNVASSQVSSFHFSNFCHRDWTLHRLSNWGLHLDDEEKEKSARRKCINRGKQQQQQHIDGQFLWIMQVHKRNSWFGHVQYTNEASYRVAFAGYIPWRLRLRLRHRNLGKRKTCTLKGFNWNTRVALSYNAPRTDFWLSAVKKTTHGQKYLNGT